MTDIVPLKEEDEELLEVLSTIDDEKTKNIIMAYITNQVRHQKEAVEGLKKDILDYKKELPLPVGKIETGGIPKLEVLKIISKRFGK